MCVLHGVAWAFSRVGDSPKQKTKINKKMRENPEKIEEILLFYTPESEMLAMALMLLLRYDRLESEYYSNVLYFINDTA